MLSVLAFGKAWSYVPKMALPVQTELNWAIIPVLDMIIFLTELKMH